MLCCCARSTDALDTGPHADARPRKAHTMSAQPASRSGGASDPAATGGSRHVSGQVPPGHVTDAALPQRPKRGDGPGQVTDDLSTAHWASGLIGAGARRQFRAHSWIFGSDERT
jgi:hypothetical protein